MSTTGPALEANISNGNKSKILLIDDIDVNLSYLTEFVELMGHEAYPFNNGREALNSFEHIDFDLVITDLMMPHMNGREILRIIKKNKDICKTPVLIVSAIGDMKNIIECLEEGADDYLSKPFNQPILKVRINSCLNRKRLMNREEKYRRIIEMQNKDLEKKVMSQIREISSAQTATIFALAKLSESRDNETGQHLERMREYCKVLAKQLHHKSCYSDMIDSSFIENLHAASPLHDIGKVGIEDRILLKTGKLTKNEFERMKKHTLIGAQTLEEVNTQHPGNEFIKIGIDIAKYHHERWDGSGYPYGISGRQIPLEARIVALGDVYDALTSKRCYKKAFTHDESREIIEESSGSHFDPAIFEAFRAREKDFLSIQETFRDD